MPDLNEDVVNMHKCLGLRSPLDSEVEQIARYIAARKMGLMKDPTGARLPDNLWQRYTNQATQLLRSNDADEAADLVDLLVQPT